MAKRSWSVDAELPEGYQIIWEPCSDQFHWHCFFSAVTSKGFDDRFDCWRDAWKTERKLKEAT